jgi:hypothetical protein
MPRISIRVATLAGAVVLFTSACDGMNGNPTTPAATNTSGLALLAVQPATLKPQFVGGPFVDPFCVATPPFLAFISLTFGSNIDVFLDRVRFDFVDRSGRKAIPTATAIPGFQSSLPSSTPVPFPSSLTFPTPGLVSFGGILIGPDRRRTDSFSLRFDCGVPGFGTLFVVVESTTRFGAPGITQTSVPIGF